MPSPPLLTPNPLKSALRRAALPNDHKSWTPYPWQVAPEIDSTGVWLLFGGRGTGKTDGAAHETIEHVTGPPCDRRLPGGHRFAIIAPTLGDASDACVNGPSGLRAYLPGIREITRKGGTYVIFPNGAEGKLFGAHGPEDIERLRAGGNRCFVWWEELAAWAKLKECMEHSRIGLRLGSHPYVVASTTPKVRAPIRKLIDDPRTKITTGKTSEAIHLDPVVRAELYAAYGGTRLARQELDGEMLEDIEGALWKMSTIEGHRVQSHDPPFWQRMVIGLDPSDGTDEGDEQGLCRVGISPEDHELYVLQSEGYRLPVLDFLTLAVKMAVEHGASIAVEKNHGSAYMVEVLDGVMRHLGVQVPYRTVIASQSKMTRAEPVAMLYERGKVHHVGNFFKLEDQMITFTGLGKDNSPDRLDALVWACREFTNYALEAPDPSVTGLESWNDKPTEGVFAWN